MNEKKSTHLLFEGEKIVISSDIMPVFNFLMEIEKEIESLLGFQKKLDEIREQYLDMLKFVQFLGQKLKENNIDFIYNFEKNPTLVAEKFNLHLPIRSQAIVLFASLEVLYLLHIAYEKEVDDDNSLREIAMKDSNFLKLFLNSFLLTDKNSYYKNNKARLSKIDSGKIRGLRNSLTHFFSLSASGVSMAPKILDEKARKFENILKQNKHGNIVFISPEDLYELIRYSYVLRMKKWSDDFQSNPDDFKRKIEFVINVVKKYGAIVVQNKDLIIE